MWLFTEFVPMNRYKRHARAPTKEGLYFVMTWRKYHFSRLCEIHPCSCGKQSGICSVLGVNYIDFCYCGLRFYAMSQIFCFCFLFYISPIISSLPLSSVLFCFGFFSPTQKQFSQRIRRDYNTIRFVITAHIWASFGYLRRGGG